VDKGGGESSDMSPSEAALGMIWHAIKERPCWTWRRTAEDGDGNDACGRSWRGGPAVSSRQKDNFRDKIGQQMKKVKDGFGVATAGEILLYKFKRQRHPPVTRRPATKPESSITERWSGETSRATSTLDSSRWMRSHTLPHRKASIQELAIGLDPIPISMRSGLPSLLAPSPDDVIVRPVQRESIPSSHAASDTCSLAIPRPCQVSGRLADGLL
jgi:hypothetical protein